MDPTVKSMFRDEYALEGAARYGVSPEALAFVGGFQNFIYTYARSGEKYILRFTPSTLRTLEGVAAELEWIRYLAAHGILAAEPVQSAEGKDIERIEGEEVHFYVTSFYHAPGEKIGYPACLGNATLYEQCGRMTGRLLELSRHYKPKHKRHSWTANEYIRSALRYLPPEDQPVLDALEALTERLSQLAAGDDRFGLIHADINVGNFTLDASAGLTLFDFDECQYSWYAEDIAIQLYYLLYVYGEDSKADRKKQFELFMRHFEMGYTEAGRRMPEGWRDQLGDFLRLREIIVYVGMHRSWDLSQPDDWTRDFLRDSRMRITSGVSLIDGL